MERRLFSTFAGPILGIQGLYLSHPSWLTVAAVVGAPFSLRFGVGVVVASRPRAIPYLLMPAYPVPRQVFDNIAQTWRSWIVSVVMRDKSIDSGMPCIIFGTPHTVRRCRFLTTAKFLVDLWCSSYKLWVSRILSDAFLKGFDRRGWMEGYRFFTEYPLCHTYGRRTLRNSVHHREILSVRQEAATATPRSPIASGLGAVL